MTCGPRIHISPASDRSPSLPGGRISAKSASVRSTTLHSVFATGRPIDASGVSPRVETCVTGDASVIPKPCRTATPSRFWTASASFSSSAAAPESTVVSEEMSYWSISGCLASTTAIGGATKVKSMSWTWCSSRNRGRSKAGMVTMCSRLYSEVLSSTFIP